MGINRKGDSSLLIDFIFLKRFYTTQVSEEWDRSSIIEVIKEGDDYIVGTRNLIWMKSEVRNYSRWGAIIN